MTRTRPAPPVETPVEAGFKTAELQRMFDDDKVIRVLGEAYPTLKLFLVEVQRSFVKSVAASEVGHIVKAIGGIDDLLAPFSAKNDQLIREAARLAKK